MRDPQVCYVTETTGQRLGADLPRLVHADADRDISRWHCLSLDHDEAADLVRRWNDAWSAESDASWAVIDPLTGSALDRVALREIRLSSGFAEVSSSMPHAASNRGGGDR